MIPGYYSLEALFSLNKADDTQWLTVGYPDILLSSFTNKLLAVLGCLLIPYRIRECYQCCLLVPILLYIQVCLCSLARTPSYQVSLTLFFSGTPIDTFFSGAQIVFRSLIQPVFARYFSGPGATAANLQSKFDNKAL